MKIKEYYVEKEIGAGGMGKVYLVTHPDLETKVILKELKETHRDFSNRFKLEAKIMMSLRHDNIAAFNDFFTFEGKKYIAMEFIDGISLAEVIEKKRRIDPAIALLILSEIARGLAYSHSKKILHRDLKPRNILISRKGEVKIIDFGIASSLDDETLSENDGRTMQDLTMTGVMMGTPSYMSPEQLRDTKRVTEKSDIYSLGVVIYEMLTGEHLFRSDLSTMALMERINEGYKAPASMDRSFPVFFKGMLRKSLNVNAAKRYRNVSAIQKKLDKYIRHMSTGDINHCIAENIFNDRYADELSKMRPLYSSFLASFSESQWRRRILFVGAGAVVAGMLFWGLFYTDLKYHLFMRNRIGSLEIRYALPLPHIAKLPDPKKYPGLYKERSQKAEERIYKFIDQWYLNMLPNFRLRAWLIRFDEKKNRQQSAEELVLIPINFIEQGKEDFKVVLGQGRAPDDYLRMGSPVLFREKGNYAVKVQFNSTAYWSYLKLEPISRQSKTHLVDIFYRDTPRSKVSFDFKFIDVRTGKRIYDVEVLILRRLGGSVRWLKWDKLAQNKNFLDNLYNGQNYYFLFKHPDYDTGKSVSIFTSKDDRMIDLTLRFKPLKKTDSKD